ncbi:MAG: hypothetical protein KO464_02285 [Candidatus Methanofastidiosum sp.]|nr:hypothetical protein [Methanofastidiosum sp.]
MNFTPKELFEEPNLINPLYIIQEAERLLGASLDVSEPVTTMEYLLGQRNYRVHPKVKEKLHAFITLGSIPSLTEWQVFELVANTVIDGEYLETQRPPSFIETVLTLDLLTIKLAPIAVKDSLSEEVKRYIGTVWKFRGGLVFPKDYAFLDEYIFATPSGTKLKPEQERARKIADKFISAKYPLSAFKETTDGVLAARIQMLEEGRKMFRIEHYISKDLFFNIP